MIKLQDLSKIYRLHGHHKTVADRINAVFPSGQFVGLLGRNGAGKTSLLRMIAGSMDPDGGAVQASGSISWPVGFGGAFHPELTGAQNVKFVARVYGVDTAELLHFVADFARLGGHFNLPFRTYSSGMRARLAFGVSMGIRFDTYLVDEVTAVGDLAFREKSKQVFAARLKDSGAIMVSHSAHMIRAHCQAGAVLEDGKLTYYENLNDAIAHHDDNMARTI